MDSVKIGGIDPGLASGGLVVIEAWPETVIAVKSLVAPKGLAKQATEETREILSPMNGWGDVEFISAYLRAIWWRDTFEQSLDQIEEEHGPIDFFAIESFVDQRSRAREEKKQLLRNRWHAPLLMGMVGEVLEKRDKTVRNRGVTYQNAGIVIRQSNVEIARLKARKGSEDLIVPGDSAVTNDHLRKAMAHALAFAQRKRKETHV